MKSFQNLINERRKVLKLTQKDLAEKLNVSDKTISKWETGRSYPEITLLSTLAKALEMDLIELLEADEFKEMKIDLEDSNSYDYAIIEKYKNKSLINIGLIIASIILILSSIFIDDKNFKIFIVVIGLILSIFSIIFFINNNLNYRNFYTKRFYTRLYDFVYSMYTTTTIIIYTSPFLLMGLLINSINISTIEGIVNIFSLGVSALSVYLNINTLKSANFKIKNDIINKLLVIVAILLFLTVLTNILPIFILPLIYILLYIVIFRKSYKES